MRFPRRNQVVTVTSSSPEGLDDRTGRFADVYHRMLTSSWLTLLLEIVGAFILVNLLFAAGYRLTRGVANARTGALSELFFFSVETMATVGDNRMVPINLPAHVLMSLEALTGLIGLALVTGIAFAKFSRPTARVRFSRYAVLSQRDGVPSLMFRLANARPNQIVEAQVHVLLARSELTVEGEAVWRFHDLELSRARNGTFRHSWTVVHPIRPHSPLYGLGPEKIAAQIGELVISMTGIDGVFMQTVYARYVYRPRDIVWGARLSDVLIRDARGGFAIDYGKFDAIEAATPPQWRLPAA